MRPCQPYLVALRRTLLATSLTGFVQAALWLVTGIAVSSIVDMRLAGEPLLQVVPWVIAVSVAGSSAVLLALTRLTVLNRRRVWIDHALGEAVVEFEVSVAGDGRQRARSLAAVGVLSRFTGSTAARALADTPWALLAIGAIWFIDIDMAVIASTAALVLIVMTVASVHLSPRAHTFDHAATAHSEGEAIVRAAAFDPDVIAGQARATARSWEATQGAHLSLLYSTAQASGRRRIGAAVIMGCAAVMMGVVLLERPLVYGHTVGGIIATAGLIMAALAVLARGAVGSPLTAQARAARNHLLLLRHAGGRHAHARARRPAGPDLRAPLAASFGLSAAAAAALVATLIHWNQPRPMLGSSLDTPAATQKSTDAAPAGLRAGQKDKS